MVILQNQGVTTVLETATTIFMTCWYVGIICLANIHRPFLWSRDLQWPAEQLGRTPTKHCLDHPGQWSTYIEFTRVHGRHSKALALVWIIILHDKGLLYRLYPSPSPNFAPSGSAGQEPLGVPSFPTEPRQSWLWNFWKPWCQWPQRPCVLCSRHLQVGCGYRYLSRPFWLSVLVLRPWSTGFAGYSLVIVIQLHHESSTVVRPFHHNALVIVIRCYQGLLVT